MKPKELAQKIGINYNYLLNMSMFSERYYKKWQIPKRDGSMRNISAPNKDLKAIQGWVLRFLLENITVSDRANGFIKKKSIKNNAQSHLYTKYILSIDIEDFFPSIKYETIQGIFEEIVNNKETSEILANLTTLNNGLPQGGVTSPCLSNLAFFSIDEEIKDLCDKECINYTRYADDLTFSSNYAPKLSGIYEQIESILQRFGFYINKNKTRFMGGQHRNRITGINLNSGRLTISKNKKKYLRAALFNYFVKGEEVNIDNIKGMISFISFIEPDFYNKMKNYKEKIVNKFGSKK
jgi:RNA-directed DNA polymerase